MLRINVKKIIGGIIAIVMACNMIFAPIETRAANDDKVCTRDDGIWLFPLKRSDFNGISDWAGCETLKSGKCLLCGGKRHYCSVHASSPNYGLDIGANKGKDIIASRSGRLYSDGKKHGPRGIYAIIEHPLNDKYSYYSLYQHLNGVNLTKEQKENVIAKEVSVGDKIGICGNTGVGTGEHLHFEIFIAIKGQGKSLAENVDGNKYYAHTGSAKYLQEDDMSKIGNAVGINNNPKNDFKKSEYICGCEGNVKKHRGSVTYSFDKEEVIEKEIKESIFTAVKNSDTKNEYITSATNGKYTAIVKGTKGGWWVDWKTLSLSKKGESEKVIDLEKIVRDKLGISNKYELEFYQLTVIDGKFIITGYASKDGKNKAFIMKIKSDKDIEVKNVKEFNFGWASYGGFQIYKVNNVYIAISNSRISPNRYYTSTDFKNWKKRTCETKISKYTKKLGRPMADGGDGAWIDILFATDNALYIDEKVVSNKYVTTHHVMYTTDGVNFKEATSFNKFIKTNNNKRDRCYCSKYSCKNEKNHGDGTDIWGSAIGKNNEILSSSVTRYIKHDKNSCAVYKNANLNVYASKGVNNFKEIIGYKGTWTYRGIFADNKEAPNKVIMFLNTSGNKNNKIYVSDVKNDTNKCYDTTLDASKINTIVVYKGYTYILYNGTKLYVSKDYCKTMKKVKVDVKNIVDITFAGENMILIGNKGCDYFIPVSVINKEAN